MAIRINDPDHRVGGDPAGDADDQAGHIKPPQLFCRGIGSLILRIINDKACVQELVIQLPQLCQRLIVLKVKPFDGCVHFTEAYKSNFLLHHKICSSLYPSAL